MKRENIQSGKLIIIYSHTFSGHEKAPTASAKKNKKEITIVTWNLVRQKNAKAENKHTFIDFLTFHSKADVT